MQLRLFCAGLLAIAAFGCDPKIRERSRAQTDVDGGSAGGELVSVDVVVTEADGVVSAGIAAGSADNQVVRATQGAMAGIVAIFAPGTFSADTTVTLQEGETLADDAVAAALGVPAGSIQAGSVAILTESNPAMDPSRPFALQVNLSAPPAALQDSYAELVLLYKRVEHASGNTVLGVLPRSALQVDGSTLTISAANFGVFQAAYSSYAIAAEQSVAAATPPGKKSGGDDAKTDDHGDDDDDDASDDQKGTPPSLSFQATVPASPANAVEIHVRGTATDGSSVTLYGDADCADELGTAPANEFKDPGIAVTVAADVETSLYAMATGVDGTTSACTKLTAYRHDAKPPAAPTVSGNALSSSRRPTWSWSGDDEGGVGIYRSKLDDSDLSQDATEESDKTSWTPGADLSDGDHTLYVQERDAAGNWSPAGSAKITVDNSLPLLTLDSLATNAYVSSQSKAISGTCESQLAVALTFDTGVSGPASVTCSAGAWSATLTFANAVATAVTHELTVASTDAAGNTTTVTRSYKYGLPKFSALELWLDTAAVDSADVTGGLLSTWTSRDADAETLSASGSPAFGTHTIAGKPVMSFGSSSYYNAGTTGDLQFVVGTSEFAVVVVYQFGASSSDGALIGLADNSGAQWLATLQSGKPSFKSGTNVLSGSAAAVDTPHLSTFVVQATGSVSSWLDGAADLAASSATTATTLSGIDVLLGAHRSSGGTGSMASFGGQIAEVLVFSATLTTAERQAIEHYLADKWGISLP